MIGRPECVILYQGRGRHADANRKDSDSVRGKGRHVLVLGLSDMLQKGLKSINIDFPNSISGSVVLGNVI